MLKRVSQCLGSVCLLAVACLSGIAGWAQAAAPSNPELVLKIDPGHVTALWSLAEKASLTDGRSLDDAAGMGAMLMRRAPLLDAPLVYAGNMFAADGDAAAARQAFTLALKRQPRNVRSLSWLAADAIEGRQFGIAVEYLERLGTLNPGETQVYANTLASIAVDEAGAETLELQLASGSKIAELALEQLNATSGDIPLLLRLNELSPASQGSLIERVLAEKGALAAFSAWRFLASPADVQAISWPFDPVFVGSTAPPPFNWRITAGAEILQQGGLYISYSGRDMPVFAQQIMMLEVGRYRFQVEMDGAAQESGGKFEWRLQCYQGNRELGSVKISHLTSTLTAQGFRFEVPQGNACAGQRILVRGLPGEFPGRVRAIVRRVQIQPLYGTD